MHWVQLTDNFCHNWMFDTIKKAFFTARRWKIGSTDSYPPSPLLGSQDVHLHLYCPHITLPFNLLPHCFDSKPMLMFLFLGITENLTLKIKNGWKHFLQQKCSVSWDISWNQRWKLYFYGQRTIGLGKRDPISVLSTKSFIVNVNFHQSLITIVFRNKFVSTQKLSIL